MGFFGSLFKRANEIEFLTRKCEFLDAELTKVETKLKLAEHTILAERKAKDKFMLRYCDQISVQHKLYGVFTKDAATKEEQKIELSPDDEARIEWMAEQMRLADIDAGDEGRPIEAYINVIRENPDKYILN